MAKTIDDLFVYLRIVSDILLILGILLLYKGKLRRISGTLPILLYCIYNVIFFFLEERITNRTIGIVIYSSYTLIEYAAFAYFILLFVKNAAFKKFMIISSILFILSIITIIAFTEFKIIDTIPIGLETILILIFSFYYLYEQMGDLGSEYIYNKFPFWVISGMLIYLAGSFFIYVFAGRVDTAILKEYWFLTNAFYFLKNIIIAIGLYMLIKKPKTQHPKELYPYLN